MANTDYKGSSTPAQFAPLATLAENIDYLDRTIKLGATSFPRTDSLHVGMAALCDEEWMAVVAIEPGVITVKRGCADTVPARHGAGTLIWFVEVSVTGSDSKEHTAGETNSIKYSPFTTGGSLQIEKSGIIDVVTYNYRVARPYPPGHVLVNGDRWWIEHTLSADEGPLTLTFTYRDRVLEADQLVDHDDADIGPEAGTTYTARIYDANGTLKNTFTGIMADKFDRWGNKLPVQWKYEWAQAMNDLDGVAAEIGTLVPGTITLFATRDDFDSWQGYTIPFKLDTQGYFIKADQLAMLAAQGDDIGTSDYPPSKALYSGQVAQIAAQTMTDADMRADSGPVDGVYVARLHEDVGQETNFYTPLNRNMFEAPYALLRKRGESVDPKLVTVVARPSDRLTDAHSLWTRYDWPAGHGAPLAFQKRIDPAFTPWVTVGATLDYLDTTLTFDKTSFLDGVPLSAVQPGQVALVDGEIIRIDARDATTFTIARGCYDTVPTKHSVGARVWLFEAAAGNDPTAYPYTLDTYRQLGSAAEVKLVPAVYGPPLNLADIPTDRITMQHRVERPYAPGEVLVNGRPWFNGCVIQKDATTLISWAHRNRDTQGGQAVDHHAPTRAPEDGQKYRLSIVLTLYDATRKAYYTVTVRDQTVDGTEFQYTYSMAQTDGYRAGTLLRVCGRVTVGMRLETIRGDLRSWQGYVIPLALPAPACAPGQPPGGGQLPPPPPPPVVIIDPPPPSGDDNTGSDPGSNDSGDNGGNGPPPPDVPPDWPDPVDPPPTPDPDDPNPELASHWDTNWDRHWDAYTKDNRGT